MEIICPITNKECFGTICEFYNKDMKDCVIRDTSKISEVKEEESE